MPWKCPKCEAEIDQLSYSVATNGTEYGTAQLDDENKEGRDRICDHDFDESGDSDWDGNPEYTCRECDTEINIDDLIWFDSEEEIEKEEKEKKEDEEVLHSIIKPEKEIISKDNIKDASQSSIICKNCRHMFVASESYQEEFYDCPKCGITNSTEEFKKLLKEGYYSQKKKDDTNKQKIKHGSIKSMVKSRRKIHS